MRPKANRGHESRNTIVYMHCAYYARGPRVFVPSRDNSTGRSCTTGVTFLLLVVRQRSKNDSSASISDTRRANGMPPPTGRSRHVSSSSHIKRTYGWRRRPASVKLRNQTKTKHNTIAQRTGEFSTFNDRARPWHGVIMGHYGRHCPSLRASCRARFPETITRQN